MNGRSPSPIVAFASITLYPPGQPPIEIPGRLVLGTRVEDGVTLVACLDEEGRQVNYVGMPYRMVTGGQPTGLVAPGRIGA
jgi:hypothetical protein